MFLFSRFIECEGLPFTHVTLHWNTPTDKIWLECCVSRVRSAKFCVISIYDSIECSTKTPAATVLRYCLLLNRLLGWNVFLFSVLWILIVDFEPLNEVKTFSCQQKYTNLFECQMKRKQKSTNTGQGIQYTKYACVQLTYLSPHGSVWAYTRFLRVSTSALYKCHHHGFFFLPETNVCAFE